MAFQVSQDADGQGQESGEARFYAAARSSGNHRAQGFVVEEHGAGSPADHGGASVHEDGIAVQHFAYKLAAGDDDGDAHHEAEDYQKEITIDHIIEVVCEYLNLDFARFNSTERTREIAQARQIAMYLAKQHTKAPLTTIGSAIGGRNHATVLHSCKAVTNLMETDKAFCRQVEEIEKRVLAK